MHAYMHLSRMHACAGMRLPGPVGRGPLLTPLALPPLALAAAVVLVLVLTRVLILPLPGLGASPPLCGSDTNDKNVRRPQEARRSAPKCVESEAESEQRAAPWRAAPRRCWPQVHQERAQRLRRPRKRQRAHFTRPLTAAGVSWHPSPSDRQKSSVQKSVLPRLSGGHFEPSPRARGSDKRHHMFIGL